ncbi:MAG TPA: class I SAM-dependent methyltransferase [Ignavibacteria bacterium]|nr:class I SAM-dependent methyltransferase [Ignavibacteria bacterium]
MNRFEYLRKVYSKKWTVAREEYGTTDHEKFLISLARQLCPHGSYLDVGIGTGEPFATTFINLGCSVEGVDIANNLTGICKSKGIKVSTGNAEEGLDYPDNTFDLVYCFNTTWYFKNIEKVINEMIRVSKKWVVFDIMDATDHVVRRNHFIYRLKHPFKPKYEFEVNPDRIKKLGNFKEYKKDKPIFVFEKNS